MKNMDVWLEGKGSEGKSECSRVESGDQKCATFCEPITRDESGGPFVFSQDYDIFVWYNTLCVEDVCGVLIKQNLERV